ncbi:uncharacterized protein LOC115629385 [Scaptodrosophila lebanonensis]|uniref:Uncharacterized protein LOC115629385 n=1 Tax=Drosophila lebanonensis TaxID=7225 RepID=A0A6J2U021_DROLE|nr:uncharacterized protein LOC115629385 [Scaptodrosophila lebanonensis]
MNKPKEADCNEPAQKLTEPICEPPLSPVVRARGSVVGTYAFYQKKQMAQQLNDSDDKAEQNNEMNKLDKTNIMDIDQKAGVGEEALLPWPPHNRYRSMGELLGIVQSNGRIQSLFMSRLAMAFMRIFRR